MGYQALHPVYLLALGGVKGLLRICGPDPRVSKPLLRQEIVAYFGARVELSCTLRSLPALSTMLIWSALHTLTT